MLIRRNRIWEVVNKYCASNWSVGPCWMPKGKPCKRKPACPSCKRMDRSWSIKRNCFERWVGFYCGWSKEMSFGLEGDKWICGFHVFLVSFLEKSCVLIYKLWLYQWNGKGMQFWSVLLGKTSYHKGNFNPILRHNDSCQHEFAADFILLNVS